MAVVAMTSNLRGASPPQASPAEDSTPNKSKRPANQPAPKGQE